MLESNNISEAEAETWLRHAMSPTEGTEVFSRIMEHSFPQVIISTRDIMVINQPPKLQAAPVSEEETGVKESPGKLYPRPELSTEYVVPNTEFEKTCANILQQYFGFEKIGIHDNLFDFGVTSLEMIHINDRLNKELKKDIPLVIMFEFPTIYSLGQHLCPEEMEETPEAEYNLNKQENRLYDTINILKDAS